MYTCSLVWCFVFYATLKSCSTTIILNLFFWDLFIWIWKVNICLVQNQNKWLHCVIIIQLFFFTGTNMPWFKKKKLLIEWMEHLFLKTIFYYGCNHSLCFEFEWFILLKRSINCWFPVFLLLCRNCESVCCAVNTGFLSTCPPTVRTCWKSSWSWTLPKEAAWRYAAPNTKTHCSSQEDQEIPFYSLFIVKYLSGP